jgi:hypothetical protein
MALSGKEIEVEEGVLSLLLLVPQIMEETDRCRDAGVELTAHHPKMTAVDFLIVGCPTRISQLWRRP